MLKGKTSLITGSTSGIGLAIAEALAKQGANVVLNGFGDQDEIEAMRARIAEEHGVTAIYSPADMSRPEEIQAMITLAAERFGAVDILVNNAGIQHVAAVDEFPDDRWEAVLSINLSSNFYAIKAALPAMRSRGWGRIVNVASAHGLVASEKKAAYVAAKHGVVGLTKTVALDTGGSGVTCNAICPGWVMTPLVAKQIEARAAEAGTSIAEAELALVSEKMPSKTFVTPEQVGGLAVFLCSDAAAQITGASIPIDGGWTAT